MTKVNSFLLLCDTNGAIKEVFWSNPPYLLPIGTDNIADLFKGEARFFIDSLISEGHTKHLLLKKAFLMLIGGQNRLMNAWFVFEESYFVVYAADITAQDDCCVATTVEQVALEKVLVLIARQKLVQFGGNRHCGTNIEAIQKLNSELVNSRRSLAKAYATIEQQALVLHSRLVEDALTGLTSTYQYHEAISTILNKYPKRLGIFAFIDLDNFKQINDNFGHDMGDKYLVGVAKRIKSLDYPDSVYLRIGGDEFGVFVGNLTVAGVEQCKKIYADIYAKVCAKPIKIDDRELAVAISVGFSIYGLHSLDLFEIIDFADKAMYRVKHAGKNYYSVYDKNDVLPMPKGGDFRIQTSVDKIVKAV